MPAEVQRLHHPIAQRDRNLLRLVAIAFAVALLAVAAAIVIDQHETSQAHTGTRGCVTGSVAGLMGGGTVKGCGAAGAANICHLYAVDHADIAAQCKALGVKYTP